MFSTKARVCGRQPQPMAHCGFDSIRGVRVLGTCASTCGRGVDTDPITLDDFMRCVPLQGANTDKNHLFSEPGIPWNPLESLGIAWMEHLLPCHVWSLFRSATRDTCRRSVWTVSTSSRQNRSTCARGREGLGPFERTEPFRRKPSLNQLKPEHFR